MRDDFLKYLRNWFLALIAISSIGFIIFYFQAEPKLVFCSSQDTKDSTNTKNIPEREEVSFRADVLRKFIEIALNDTSILLFNDSDDGNKFIISQKRKSASARIDLERIFFMEDGKTLEEYKKDYKITIDYDSIGMKIEFYYDTTAKNPLEDSDEHKVKYVKIPTSILMNIYIYIAEKDDSSKKIHESKMNEELSKIYLRRDSLYSHKDSLNKANSKKKGVKK